ncbi:Meiotic recombination protein rec24 [Schizosaccharomyces pombe]|uniref:Meiotic recombination protein rec24 n=1 Tax=Schizosaccharomyces pombe (strain 972 / ATCC 24843) TaxID=284812 RepID=REC24_SCHPO
MYTYDSSGETLKIAIAWKIILKKPKGKNIKDYIEALRKGIEDQEHCEKYASTLLEPRPKTKKDVVLKNSNVTECVALKAKPFSKKIEDMDIFLLTNVHENLQEKRQTSGSLAHLDIEYTFNGLFRFLKCTADIKLKQTKVYEGADFLRIKTLFEEIFMFLKRDCKSPLVLTRLVELGDYVLDLIIITQSIMQNNANNGTGVISRAKFLEFYVFLEQLIFNKLSFASVEQLEKLLDQIVKRMKICFTYCKNDNPSIRLLYSECFFSYAEIYFPCLHSFDAQLSSAASKCVQILRDIITNEELQTDKQELSKSAYSAPSILLIGLKDMLFPEDIS